MVVQYRLEEKLGQGGMGIVYKAFDTRLKRKAAIKVLSTDLVTNLDRRLRFKREAQSAAALNHPNIAVLYEIGEHEGTPFLAMEYVEGKSLRALVDLGPLGTVEALRVALQIAAGVGRAHQAGIVHRDLKPENVIITGDGQVKILDFGLAKLWGEPQQEGPGNVSRLETISREGRILGTASYMSPEQIRGEGVDPRSDLFSFGVLLYELVTGRVPFDGPSAMDTLSAILRDSPPPARSLNPDLPEELERILGKCLEKDPDHRYQSAGDLEVDLRQLERLSDSQPFLRPPESRGIFRGTARRRLVMGGIAVALLAVLAGHLQPGGELGHRRRHLTRRHPPRLRRPGRDPRSGDRRRGQRGSAPARWHGRLQPGLVSRRLPAHHVGDVGRGRDGPLVHRRQRRGQAEAPRERAAGGGLARRSEDRLSGGPHNLVHP
jgi:serine/threonine protein kinase